MTNNHLADHAKTLQVTTAGTATSMSPRRWVGAAESLAPAKDVEGSGGEGVVVLNLDPSSPAAQVGVQAGYVILNASGKTVQTPEDVR